MPYVSLLCLALLWPAAAVDCMRCALRRTEWVLALPGWRNERLVKRYRGRWRVPLLPAVLVRAQ